MVNIIDQIWSWPYLVTNVTQDPLCCITGETSFSDRSVAGKHCREDLHHPMTWSTMELHWRHFFVLSLKYFFKVSLFWAWVILMNPSTLSPGRGQVSRDSLIIKGAFRFLQVPSLTPTSFFDGLDVEKWPLSLNIGNKVPFRKGPRLGFQHTMCSPQACYLKDACIFNVDLKATEKTLFILNSI